MLFDFMLGQFEYEDDPSVMILNSILTMFHMVLASVFLINFLIAILQTVYNLMTDQGNFQYKSNVYQFIEKYSVAMLDKWNYYELVVHPPPINVFTLFLLPFIIRKS